MSNASHTVDESSGEYRNKEIKLQRDALLEYAEHNTALSPAERDQFIDSVLSNPPFFQQACLVLQRTAGILWEAALLEEAEVIDGEEHNPFEARVAVFLEESRADRPELLKMCRFYIDHWEQAFTREQQDEEGKVMLDNAGAPLYEVAMEPTQYELCEDRILDLQTRL